MTLTRRAFLARGGAFAAGFAGLHTLLRDRPVSAAAAIPADGYGPLIPDPAGILDLPEGFSYHVISKAGEEMDDGLLVPGLHDGMAAFPGPDGKTILVRNHELEPHWAEASAFGAKYERLAKVDRSRFYDYGAGKMPCPGGTTTLLYDTRTQRLEKHFLSLTGTVKNCAGGPTPWGTWLTCEEWTAPGGRYAERPHGFVFEVPASVDRPGLVDPVPLTAMGRFIHEAVAVDPASGCIYQTEDIADGLIYRFIPSERQRLAAGGRLQALVVRDRPSLDTRNWTSPAVRPGEKLAVRWIDIEDVLSPNDDLRYQGFSKGAARFARNEGMWYGNRAVYWCATNGGPTQKGQIWRYTPSPAEGTPEEDQNPGTLELFIEAGEGSILEYGDNITVAPWGDLIVCEDEAGPADGKVHILGVTPAGREYRLARNAMSRGEMAGATFSPDGTTLFVNIQRPGLTLAITGPWRRG